MVLRDMEQAPGRPPDWRAWALCLLVAVGAYLLRHLLRDFRDVPGPAILALIAGVIIRAGDLVIDGSVRGKLRKLATELQF